MKCIWVQLKFNFCWTNRGSRLNFAHLNEANKFYSVFQQYLITCAVISQKMSIASHTYLQLTSRNAAASSWNETEWNQNLLRITWDSNGEISLDMSESKFFVSFPCFISDCICVLVCVQWPYCTCFTYSGHI